MQLGTQEPPEPISVSEPSSLRSAAELTGGFVLSLFLVVLLVVGLIWAWAFVTAWPGDSSDIDLEQGDSVQIVESELTVRVPEGWSGNALSYYPLPAWTHVGQAHPHEYGLLQEIRLHTDGMYFTAIVYKDEALFDEVTGRVLEGAAEELRDLAGTPFDRPTWTGYSKGVPHLAVARVVGRDSSDGAAVHMLVSMPDGTQEEAEKALDTIVVREL